MASDAGSGTSDVAVIVSVQDSGNPVNSPSKVEDRSAVKALMKSVSLHPPKMLGGFSPGPRQNVPPGQVSATLAGSPFGSDMSAVENIGLPATPMPVSTINLSETPAGIPVVVSSERARTSGIVNVSKGAGEPSETSPSEVNRTVKGVIVSVSLGG